MCHLIIWAKITQRVFLFVRPVLYLCWYEVIISSLRVPLVVVGEGNMAGTMSELVVKLSENQNNPHDFSWLISECCRRSSNVDHLTYLALNLPCDSPKRLVFTTYDAAWSKHYADEQYEFVDPVIIQGLQGILPLDWGIIPHKSAVVKRFFGEAREFGITDRGLSVPIRGVYGELGLFSINADISSSEWFNYKKELISDLTYSAYLFHDLVLRQYLPKEWVETITLSPRELETLKWASEGWTYPILVERLSLFDCHFGLEFDGRYVAQC